MASDKKFGIFFSFIFFATCLFFYYFSNNDNLLKILVIITVVFILLTIFKPKLLYQLKLCWYNLGIVIGLFITPIIFSLFYYLIFTPFGIVSRILDKENDYNFKIKKKNLLEIN